MLEKIKYNIFNLIFNIFINCTQQKKRILFWLEDHYYHFGIAKFLQDLYDCEISAIISATPSAKKFYLEQDLIILGF